MATSNSIGLRSGERLPDVYAQRLNWPDDSSRFGLLLFVRGPWCPVCRRQVSRFTDVAEEIRALESHIFIIATNGSVEFVPIIEGWQDAISLVDDDSGAEMVTGLGIEAKHPDHGIIARPATLIVDREGVIHFAHVGQHTRDRPEPSAIVLAIRSLALETFSPIR